MKCFAVLVERMTRATCRRRVSNLGVADRLCGRLEQEFDPIILLTSLDSDLALVVAV
jgi:hypothetical protein